MHVHDLSPWQHRHDYRADRAAAERRTHWVIGITLVMMGVEIGAGWWWHSMALLADGWHMGTHAAAIGVAALSYALARRWADDARFSLGPWKVEVLGAYTSAVLLGVVAIGIGFESVLRLWAPQPVAYDQSLVVAALGLIVNGLCARLLHSGDAPGHSHAHGPAHAAHHSHHDQQGHAQLPAPGDEDACDPHGHGHEPAHGDDLNLRAAYLHVLADAATSVLAIGALLAGKYAGWERLDPVIGLLGALLIAGWSIGLLRQTSKILLDREMDNPLADQVRQRLESDGDARVADLHLWRIGDARFACQITLVADAPLSPDVYRSRLDGLPALAHVSIEANRCRGGWPAAAPAHVHLAAQARTGARTDPHAAH